MYFQRLKKVLERIYNSDLLENPDKLYEVLLTEKSESYFNSKYDEILRIFCLYIYNNNQSLQTLTKNTLPFEIGKEEEFSTFFNKFTQYQNYSFDSIYPSDNYYKLLFRALGNRKKIHDGDHWFQITKENLEETNKQSIPSTYKIYLPIANESLHIFANTFFSLCKGRNVNYDFKLNNDDNISRSDNVVIYANDSNIKEYIDIIEFVLKISPNIKINYEQLHLLAYPYNNHIAIAPNIDYGGKSFSEIICNQLCSIKKTSADFNEFYKNVENLMNNYFNDFSVRLSQIPTNEPEGKTL